jgi:hypothetical protein
MGTREDAGGPGVAERVLAAWRAALGGLWLAVRALASRHPVEPPDGPSG